MEELKNFNTHDLFRLIGKPDDEFLQWLKDKKLVWTSRYCECGKEMSLVHKKDANWPIWKCNSRKNHDENDQQKGFLMAHFFLCASIT